MEMYSPDVVLLLPLYNSYVYVSELCYQCNTSGAVLLLHTLPEHNIVSYVTDSSH